MVEMIHQSVMPDEVVDYLKPKSGEIYLDATFGAGGHSKLILKATNPDGKVICLDRDPEVIQLAKDFKREYGERFQFQNISYIKMEDLGVKVNGILFDLGLSSDQLEDSGRGFTFSKEEPLDMRFDPTHGATAADILNRSSLDELIFIFSTYAEDRYSKTLARKVVEQRRGNPLRTTNDFIGVIGSQSPKVLARLFQALRIAVNDELNVLSRGLDAADRTLMVGGRLVVISFHSGEDRIVKNFLRDNGYEILTKKVCLPSFVEVERNPRCRSAKLRAGIKK